MIKEKGDRKVEEWTHDRAGVETTIYLRYTTFVATLLGEDFEAPDVSQLRTKLRDYAEHYIVMEWHPIISVEIGEPYSYNRSSGDSIQIALDRYYVSRSPNGTWFNVGWDVDINHRKAQMSVDQSGYGRSKRERHSFMDVTGLPLGAPYKTGDGKYLMDHTDELWEALDGIRKGIIGLRSRLAELVSSKKGIERLLGGGGQALLGP